MNLQNHFNRMLGKKVLSVHGKQVHTSDLASHLETFARHLSDTTGDTSLQISVPVPECSKVNENIISPSLKFSVMMFVF